MSQPNKPSPSELTLLKALWRQSPLSAKEIHSVVAEQLDWSYSSTRKTLERMEAKNFISVKEVHGIRVFSPRLGKVKTLAQLAKDFAKSVLEVKGSLPVTMFSDSELLDEQELKELERLLVDSKGKDHDE